MYLNIKVNLLLHPKREFEGETLNLISEITVPTLRKTKRATFLPTHRKKKQQIKTFFEIYLSIKKVCLPL